MEPDTSFSIENAGCPGAFTNVRHLKPLARGVRLQLLHAGGAVRAASPGQARPVRGLLGDRRLLASGLALELRRPVAELAFEVA